MDQVEISSCSTYGIRIESSNIENPAPIIGDIDVVKEFRSISSDLEFNSVSLTGNKKGDVIIKKIRNDSVQTNDADQSNDTIYLSDDDDEEEEEDDDYEDSVETEPSETNLSENKIMDEAGDHDS